MKKAQILSALALAFALGVAVIPTASTYAATFVENNKVVDNVNEKLTDAIKSAKEDCGYFMKGNTKTYYYSLYEDLVEALDDAEDHIATAEATQAGDNTTDPKTGLFKAYADAIATLKNGADSTADTADDVTLPSSIKETIPTNIKSYNSVVVYISNAMQTLNKEANSIADDDNDGDVKAAFRTAADELQTALKTAADNIDDAREGEAAAIQTAIEAIKNETFADNLSYDEAVKAANALSSNGGYTTVAKVRNLMTAIEAAQNLIDSKDTLPVSEADKAIAAINKAANGGTVTDADLPNKPSDGAGTDQNKAPNTGALANAEGSASTTVAMVAGIATALTAAGAGVVAYRNARRSTRK